ncbi:MAG: ABC transporter ATP-binding protein/permease [Oscillospiraceae bacterium]|nr:ABC transporter ATP-binding protein/permease [Oscillospiraceae bacterium]
MSICVKNLTFFYGDKEVLHEIDLAVKTGENIGIIGASGGGKSTLLKLLSGLYAPQTGIIEVQGASKPADIRRNVAMVMQNAMLFPASIKENITCGHDMSDESVARACEAAQLSDWISSLPEGMDTFVGERGGKVSGGEAQRIAIARAIAKNAPVILLDEATSALDGETSLIVAAALDNLMKGKTVASVSHRPEMLTNCDRIYRLEGGRLHDSRYSRVI